MTPFAGVSTLVIQGRKKEGPPAARQGGPFAANYFVSSSFAFRLFESLIQPNVVVALLRAVAGEVGDGGHEAAHVGVDDRVVGAV